MTSMVQKFSGEVGQVAGRDIKTNIAQTNVNVHFHSGSERKYISDRQRRVIDRKVFEIEAKTGTEKLMVYRRLMVVCKFQSMDGMPRDMYSRAVAYLDAWLQNGVMESAQAQPSSTHSCAKPPAVASPSTPRCPTAVPAQEPEATAPTAVHQIRPPARDPHSQPRTDLLAGIVIGVLVFAAGLYIEVNRRPAQAQGAATETAPLHCEYDGSRYTVGSIVIQAETRVRCVETSGHGVAWQPVANGKLH